MAFTFFVSIGKYHKKYLQYDNIQNALSNKIGVSF